MALNRPINALLIILLAICAATSATAETRLTGRASVIDGDTIEIHGQRVRLHGIDAPESGQLCRDGMGINYRCGQAAALHLDDLVRDKLVDCVSDQVDRYGRLIARCSVNGVSIGASLVYDGVAVAYRQYSNQYVLMEVDAQKAGRGLWAGDFEMPWNWRRQ